MRGKLTFSCKKDSYKLKLYNQGAALSLENTVKILSLKEATKRELQESKTAEIESVTQGGSKADPQTMNNPQRAHSSQAAGIVDTAFASTPLDGENAQPHTPDETSATNWDIFP